MPRPRDRFLSALRIATALQSLVLAGGLVAVVLFGLLARAVLGGTFDALNHGAMEAVHTLAAPWLDRVALVVTSLGSVPVVIVIGAVLVWLLRRGGRVIDAWTLVIVLGGAGVISTTLKVFFDVARPAVFEPLYHPAGMSFPSGHSLISFSLWGFVAAVLVRRRSASIGTWTAAVAALVLAVMVAFSRLYIGVHWPTDVLAGFLLAAAWLATCFWGRTLVQRRYARLQRLEDLEESA